MLSQDRRAEYRKGLSPLYLPVYDRLCEELSDAWQPFFGERSIALQDALYAKGRTIPGEIVTNAPGGASAHNYGCGTDWTMFAGESPIWLKKEDPNWAQYKDACEKVSAHWGGTFKIITDYYHNELTLTVSWSEVKKVLDQDGMGAAMAFIEKVMVK